MYAIFRTGNRQFRAEIGHEIDVEKLPYEVGDKVDFDEVLLIGDEGDAVIGRPLVKGAVVKARIVEQFRGKKVIVWKYRPSKRYRRKQGHRQQYTRLHIEDIVPPKGGASKPAAKKAAPAKAPAAQETAPAKAESAAPSPRKTLANLGVSDRVTGALAEGGISTAGAFIKALEEGGQQALLDIKGIGPKSVEEVIDILTENGYSLPE